MVWRYLGGTYLYKMAAVFSREDTGKVLIGFDSSVFWSIAVKERK